MSNVQHAPAPWNLHTGTDYISIQGNDGSDVLSEIVWAVYDDKEMANARLIAAAPEMLEALVDADALLKEIYGYEVQGGTYARIRAAIAKAKGGAA